MNLQTYQSLTADQQALMDELGRDFTVKMAEIMARSRTETKAKLAEGVDGKPITMVEPSAGMREALVEVALADVANWKAKAGDKGLDGETIFAEWIALTDKYRQDVAANGYPWK